MRLWITLLLPLAAYADVAGQFRSLGVWPSGNIKWVKACGLVSSLSAGGTATVNLTGAGTIALTVQEAIYPGSTSGIARTDEPFCVGVPIADSVGLASVSGLALTGSVTSVTDVNMATDGSTISVDTGSGGCVFTVKKANFNVLDTVVCGGTTVVATSSAATRGLVLTGPDQSQSMPAKVTCTDAGSDCTTVFSSANDASSTCSIEENGPIAVVLRCIGTHKDGIANPYMQYTARLYFYRGKPHVRGRITLRNANYDTSATPSPDCNASGGVCTGGTYNSATKGFQAYDLRIVPNISGTLNYSIATHTTPHTGTVSTAGGTDTVYIYQGQSQSKQWDECTEGSNCANKYTTDTGYTVVKNAAQQASGSSTQYPQGWADIANSSGVGIQMGIYEMAAYFPKSLEFNGGGTDARIGIYARQSQVAHYQAWPSWTTFDVYLNFHTSAPSSLANDFLKLQHYLIARASRTHYNSTNVFAYPIPSSSDEDAFMYATGNATDPALSVSKFCDGGGPSNCFPDLGITDIARFPLYFARYWAWGGPGSLKQADFRLSNLWTWIKRGQPGRYLQAAEFYKIQADKSVFHTDGTSSSSSTVNGFTFRSRPRANESNAETDGLGGPKIACQGGWNPGDSCPTIVNSAQQFLAIPDHLHNHWHGMVEYYYMTGDEHLRDAMVPQLDYYLNDNTFQGTYTNNGWPTRSYGVFMNGASKYSEYLTSIGDTTNAADVLTRAVNHWENYVKPDPCMNGYPSGCTPPVVDFALPATDPPGVSRIRGIHQGNQNRGTSWCADATNTGGTPHFYRGTSTFMTSLLIEGVLALRRAKGSSWSDYKLALDLAYGMSQWALTEAYADNGSAKWFDTPSGDGTRSLYNGFRFGALVDVAMVCPGGSLTTYPDYTFSGGSVIHFDNTLAGGWQGLWMVLYPQYLMNGRITTDQVRKMKHHLSWIATQQDVIAVDFGAYATGTLINSINNPTALLQDVTFSVSHLGSGNYRLSWTVPTGTQSYRIKWSTKAIAPSTALLGYDPVTTTAFTLDPATNSTWFGATNVTEPSPATAGTTQTFDINSTGSTSLGLSNFSVKAYSTDVLASATSRSVGRVRSVGRTRTK
jgi:hypothetical protein